MKNRILLCIAGMLSLIASTSIHAQLTTLAPYNNYNGTLGSLQNPAFPADNRLKFQFTLGLLQVAGNNNAYETKFSNAFKSSFYKNAQDGVDYFRVNNATNNRALINVDLLGPSVLFNIKNNTIGIYSRVRSIANADNINKDVIDIAANDIIPGNPYQIGNGRFQMNNFGEIGVNYSLAFLNNPQHVIKAGITGKYILGIGAMSSRTTNAVIQYHNPRNGVLDQFTGDARVLISGSFGDVQLDDPNVNNILDILGNNFGKNSGFGVDLGVSYEYRPEVRAKDWSTVKGWYSVDDHPYLLRFGASVTDIGSMSYASGAPSGTYTLTGSGKAEAIYQPNTGETVQQYINRLQNTDNGISNTQIINKFTTNLPMAFHFNVDYHPLKSFYVNANALVNLVSKTDDKQSAHYISTYSIAPRFEIRRLAIAVPFAYDELKNFKTGVTLQAGPLFIGSQSILTNLFKERTREADVFIGLNYPFFKPRPNLRKPDTTIINRTDTLLVTKDRDGDGVTDDKDECPDTPGLVALNGCPDRDGDGVADYKDKCPDTPGLAKYDGCPPPDRDNDGINDDEDKCPDVPGLARYQGCPIPDRDNDGVNDEEDKCPDVPGTVANFGCPEIKKEVIEKFNKLANSIFFATGKFAVLPKSFSALNSVVAELKKDTTLRLEIQGHTDNVGKPANNQILSDRRAASVKAHLVKKGIDPTRLKSVGFGDTKPRDTNKTAKGRAKNRRTELHLSNYDAPTDAPVTQ